VGNLRQHIRAAHARVRYPCNLCDYRATRNHDLVRHKNAKHPASAAFSPTNPSRRIAAPTNSGAAANPSVECADLLLRLSSKVVSISRVSTEPECRGNISDENRPCISPTSESGCLGVQYACSSCLFKASDHLEIFTHVTLRHAKCAFACSVCTFLAADKASLNAHIESRHKGRAAPTFKETFDCKKERAEKTEQTSEPNKENFDVSLFAGDSCEEEREVENFADFSQSECEPSVKETVAGDSIVEDGLFLLPGRKARKCGKFAAKPLQCPLCPFEAGGKVSLRKHQRAVHGAAQPWRQCDKCSYETRLASALHAHRLSVHGGESSHGQQTDSAGIPSEHVKEVHFYILINAFPVFHISFSVGTKPRSSWLGRTGSEQFKFRQSLKIYLTIYL
jgi:hypothetical protein